MSLECAKLRYVSATFAFNGSVFFVISLYFMLFVYSIGCSF